MPGVPRLAASMEQENDAPLLDRRPSVGGEAAGQACQPGASRSGMRARTVAIAFAWTSGPGMPAPTGVFWMSPSSGSTAPTTTTFPRSAAVCSPLI